VEIDTKTVNYDKEVIYFGATTDKPFNVPANGYPEDPDDHFFIDFDEPVWWMEQYNDIEVVANTSDIYVDQGVYESNFLDNVANPGVLKNPWKIELRIVNNSGSDGQITKFIIEGKKVDTAHFVASSGSGTPAEELKLSSDVIGDKDWAKRYADWLLTTHGEKWEIENIRIVDFDKHSIYELGQKVTVKYPDFNIDENALIEEITLDFDRDSITLKLSQILGETYTYPGGVGGTEEGPEVATQKGDGVPPPAPSSISATGGIGLITVSWSSVVSTGITDFAYYELQKSVNGGAYTTILLSESNSFVDRDVSRGNTYTYRVRAWDIEGMYSAYTELATPVEPAQAGSDDIGDETITANKLTVAVDLSVGRTIKVGDYIQIGYDESQSLSGIKVGDNDDGYLMDESGLWKLVNSNSFRTASIIYQDILQFDGSTSRQRIYLPALVPIDRLSVFTSFNSMQNLLDNTMAVTSYEIIPDAADPTKTNAIDIIAGVLVGIKRRYFGTLKYSSTTAQSVTYNLKNTARVELVFKGSIRGKKWTLLSGWVYTTLYGSKLKFTHDYAGIASRALKITLSSYDITDLPGNAAQTNIYNTVNWGDGISETINAYVYENSSYITMDPQPSGYPWESITVYSYEVTSTSVNPFTPIKALVNVIVFLD